MKKNDQFYFQSRPLTVLEKPRRRNLIELQWKMGDFVRTEKIFLDQGISQNVKMFLIIFFPFVAGSGRTEVKSYGIDCSGFKAEHRQVFFLVMTKVGRPLAEKRVPSRR